MKTRCKWLDLTKEEYIKYHDKDWGVQEHNDRKLFAKLILDGAQAGLSWYTILRKRDNYRKAFDNWDYKKIAKYDSNKELELLKNEGIVRNKLKIKSAIKNAQTFIKIREEFGSFDNYLWGFVNYKQIINKKQLLHFDRNEKEYSYKELFYYDKDRLIKKEYFHPKVLRNSQSKSLLSGKRKRKS